MCSNQPEQDLLCRYQAEQKHSKISEFQDSVFLRNEQILNRADSHVSKRNLKPRNSR